MTVPVAASVLRMIVATAGGWLAIEAMGLGLSGVFAAIGAGIAAYGCLMAGTLLISPWKSRR